MLVEESQLVQDFELKARLAEGSDYFFLNFIDIEDKSVTPEAFEGALLDQFFVRVTTDAKGVHSLLRIAVFADKPNHLLCVPYSPTREQVNVRFRAFTRRFAGEKLLQRLKNIASCAKICLKSCD